MATREDISIDVTSEEVNLYPSGKTYLFFIAIDQYKNGVTPLSNAVRDAYAVAECLLEHYELDRNNLQMLINEEATQKNILKAFDKYHALITDNDNLILYFSGHGTYYDIYQTGYWLTAESESGERSTFFSNDKVISFIRSLKARHIFCIVDACFSAALFNDRNHSPLVSRLYNIPSRWLLTAGRLEPVSDGSLGHHSPFAEALITYLKYQDEPYLWISELCINIWKGMVNNANQLPRGQALQGAGDHGGGFLLRRKGHATPVPSSTNSNKSSQSQIKEESNKLNLVPTVLMHLAGQNLDDIKNNLEELITDDNWKTVFLQLKQMLVRGRKRETLIQLIGRYNRIKQAKIKGTDSKKRSRILFNQIQADLLTFINDIRDKDLKSYKN